MRQRHPLQRLTSVLGVMVLATLGGAMARLAAQQQVTITSGGPGPLPLGIGPGGAPPKPLEAGTGLIFGQTVEGTSTRPVGGALVTLSVAGSIPVRVLSDSEGHYAFRDVPKGGFSVTATKPGYSDGAYGRLRPDGASQPLQLTEGQRLADVALPMWKLGAIAGTVTDESGEPIVGATVRVLKRTILGGRPQLDEGDSVTTDDRGMYRIGSLTPGDYVVVIPMAPPTPLQSLLAGFQGPAGNIGALASATAFSASTGGGGGGGGTIRLSSSGTSSVSQPAGITDDGHELWYQTTFYPTSLSASHADVLAIKAGQERGGVDFTLRAVRTASVGGTLMGPDGPVTSTRVTLVPADSGALVTPIESANAVTDGSGHFTFPPVPAGQYQLRAVKAPPSNLGDTQTFRVGGNVMVVRTVVQQSGATVPPLPTTPTLWIDAPVSVGTTDVNDLQFALRAGVRVNGHIEFNGSATQPTPDSYPTIGVSLVPADGSQSTAPVRGRVEPSGLFTTMGVPSGKYLLRVTPPANWILRGAMLGGRDIVDAAVDLRDADLDNVIITFTDKPTSLGGNVTSGTGSADPKATVIVFPQDASLWTDSGSSPRRLRSTRTSPDGSYQIGLPAGDYYVAAVTDTGAFEWNDPVFLAALATSATKVTVAEGTKHQQALRTTTPPTPGGF